jgi:hypothetical protein
LPTAKSGRIILRFCHRRNHGNALAESVEGSVVGEGWVRYKMGGIVLFCSFALAVWGWVKKIGWEVS